MTFRRGVALFLIISIAVVVAILSFSADRHTMKILMNARKEGIVLALMMVGAIWFCDATRFRLFSRAAGERLPLRLAFVLTWINYFGCAITPMQGGGGPFQMYVLYRHGVSLGKGVAITLVRTLVTLFLLGLTLPITLLVEPQILQGQGFIQGMFIWILVFVVGAWILITLSLVRPRLIKRWCGVLTFWLNRAGVVHRRSILRVVRRIHREIDEYNNNIRVFCTTGKWYFLGAILVSCLYLFCIFSVLPCLIWSLGQPVRFVECVLVQAMFMFILYFVPTPGASGVAEGGAMVLYKLLVPWNLAGVVAIGWRFFTEYTGIVMGAFVAMRYIGWDLASRLMDQEKAEEKAEEKVGCPGGDDGKG